MRAILPRKCIVGDHWVGSRHIVATVEEYRCCGGCVAEHEGPGKFQGFSDPNSLGIALILHAIDLDGGADDFMSQESWGYMARIGQYIYSTDTSGFVDFTDHNNPEDADKEFNRWYDQGWGASEDDAWIGDDRSGYGVAFDGKHIGVYPRLSRAKAKVSLLMRETGHYPNVWYEGERGNVRRLEVW